MTLERFYSTVKNVHIKYVGGVVMKYLKIACTSEAKEYFSTSRTLL